MAHKKWSLNQIFLFSLARSPRGTSLEAYRCRKITVPSLLASTCNRRIVNSTVDSQDARKTHFVRAGLIHSESTRYTYSRRRSANHELHFQSKTRLSSRSSVRSTNAWFANVLLIYIRFLRRDVTDHSIKMLRMKRYTYTNILSKSESAYSH